MVYCTEASPNFRQNKMFLTSNSPKSALSIEYNGKYIEESANRNFLSLQIDNHLNWKNHIDQMQCRDDG
jgi:hypothetical protein